MNCYGNRIISIFDSSFSNQFDFIINLPHHHRLARAIDIGIKNADAGAFSGQGQRQVHGGGALAHTALARGHGNDVLHLGQQLHPALHGVRRDLAGDVDADVFNPGQGA